MSNDAKCKSCGAPIVWAENVATGNRIPMDIRPVIYQLQEKDGKTVCIKMADQATFGISHFATCPNAAKHSKQGGSR